MKKLKKLKRNLKTKEKNTKNGNVKSIIISSLIIII